MASISRGANGRRTIQFVGADGKRRSIRLGKVTQQQAEAVKLRVEQLAGSALTGHTSATDTLRWVAEADDGLHAKLSAVGLVAARESATLGEFLERYASQRIDVKKSTLTVYRHTRRNLTEFFGAGRLMRSITQGDADQWRLFLVSQGLSESTISKRCQLAVQFFASAVRHELIPANPFTELKRSQMTNRSRFYFVSQSEAKAVIEACPDIQWRLLFALSRYAGLRCPSEHLALKWSDVDWDKSRLTITSPKTEHHGKGSRLVPIFPELQPILAEAFERAEPGSVYVITRYRDTNANLRTQLLRIIRRAGLKPWPKLFQNLRSTRETELAEQFPIHVVCEWIGNTQAIAAKHYLQVTDDHFRQAVQNPVHQPTLLSATDNQTGVDSLPKPSGKAVFTTQWHSVNKRTVDATGLEPVTSSV